MNIYSVLLAIVIVGLSLSPGFALTDAKGRQIPIDKPFSRIISLYGAHTENLLYLNCDQQLIGISASNKAASRTASKMRFSYHDGPEKFLGANPDLILIRPMIDNGYPKLIQRLESAGIVVASFQPGTVDKMYEYWLALGELTGKTKKALQMVTDFKAQIKQIMSFSSKIPNKKKVYFESIHSRMKTFSKGAMALFALETAGGINVAKDAAPSRNTNIANYSKERILAKASQIDVFLAQTGVMNKVTVAQIKNEPGFQIIKAVKENQIYLIDEDIVSRPVPRLLDGILTIGNDLYPDVFHGKQF